MTANTQDQFIQNLIDADSKVSVYLISGIKLIGTIKAFDAHTVRLDNESSSQLVFKQAISTILANR